MNKQAIFIDKSTKIHNNKYDYSKVIFVKSNIKVCIICPEHGEFWQTPKDHLTGRGCLKCGRLSTIKHKTKTKEQFINEANEVHEHRYEYPKVNYVNYKTKVCVTCTKHGDFMISPGHHLSGEGCPKCAIETRAEKNTKTLSHFVTEARRVHGNKYDYSKSEYLNSDTNICIICPEHGEFWQTSGNHFSNQQGCPDCGRISSIDSRKYNDKEWIALATTIHDGKYDYSKVNYTKKNENNDKVCIICHKVGKNGDEHGEFWQKSTNHISGQGCPKCFKEKSNIEDEISKFISGLGFEIIENDRKFLSGKEIDVLIPNKMIGFEINGLRWHNEFCNPNPKYHLIKTNIAKENDIDLIHIFEDEWLEKKEIVKSRIRNILGKTQIKIPARKCEIKEISANDAKTFLNNNHIQGNINSAIKIGLYHNNELISIMTFGKLRKNLGSVNKNNEYELLRFCNSINTTVVGGANKLLTYFMRMYKPERIISYADKRWSKGNLYEKLGFNLIRQSPPNYFYVIRKKRLNRFNFRKDILVKEGFDKNKTEHEIMIERGIPRIYDCGCLVYELKK